MRLGIREIIFILLLLAVPVAAYYQIFQPRNRDIAQARQEITVNQQKLAKLEAAMQIKDLGAEIQKLSDAITVFEEKLPAERETEVILKEVWELAARHHLVPRSVRTDKTIDGPLYSTLPIQMSIVGNFDGFYSFLLDMEKLQRLTQIPRLSLKKIDKEEGHMQADIVLHIFFESKPAAGARNASGRSTL